MERVGEKGKSQRYCAKYCKFKVLKDLACNMYGGEVSLSGNNIYSCKALRGTEEKSFEAENTRLFIRFTRDLNDNMEVLGAKKILYSPSSSTMHME